MTTPAIFSAVRISKLTSIAQLQGQSLHAMRRDRSSSIRLRPDARPGLCLSWSKAAEGNDARDLLPAFKAHKLETGAGERKKSPLALQALCIVSPEWVERTGDLHDPSNPHNTALFNAAKAWIESWAGPGSVFAARLDLDETGGGVVDVFVSPIRNSRGKPQISTAKAMKELKSLLGERNEYAALQTSWAQYLNHHLDPEIRRGTPKIVTQREHVPVDLFREGAEATRKAAREEGLREARAEILARLAEIAAQEKSRADFEIMVTQQRLTRQVEVDRKERRRQVDNFNLALDAWRDGKVTRFLPAEEGLTFEARNEQDEMSLLVKGFEIMLREMAQHFRKLLLALQEWVERLRVPLDRRHEMLPRNLHIDDEPDADPSDDLSAKR